ncbi:hypothetical protein E2320_012524 [Naja naja]|nr:hypothetical protein E2320_012524 [Naja naja]
MAWTDLCPAGAVLLNLQPARMIYPEGADGTVSGSVLEMGGEGSVPWTPLQCMLRNFKKGFSRDYGNPRSQVKKDQSKTKPVLKTEPYEEDNPPPYAPTTVEKYGIAIIFTVKLIPKRKHFETIQVIEEA